MLKTRTLTLTAVVAVGAIALGAPTLAGANPGPASPASISDQIAKLKQAGKSAKSRARTSSKWTQDINKDIKRLGENVYDLRKANDQTNFTISQIASAAISALTQLQAGLVGLAASYTNFEYGVVQLYRNGTAIAGDFLATPRIDPTVEQATVTGQFPCAAAAGCIAGQRLTAKVAVRSANPTANDAKSTAVCRVTLSQVSSTGASNWVTSSANSGVPAWPVPRSDLNPPKDAPSIATFPLSMTPYDNEVDLTTAANSSNGNGGGVVPYSFDLANNTYTGSATAGMINVTLSCLSIPH